MSEQTIADRWGVELRHVSVGAITLRVALAGQGPLVLLVHGFPESWYSWRHQIKPLCQAGYQVAAVDVRGYGGSDKPPAVTDYDMQSLTADMHGLVQQLSTDGSAIIIGHDWGAPVAWNSALLYPKSFTAVAGLSVPHVPPGDVVGIDLFRKVFTEQGKFFYMVYFQDEGVAEAELEMDVEKSLRLFFTSIAGDAAADAWPHNKAHGKPLLEGMREPNMPRPWFSFDDLDYYASQFAGSGFRGPLNRYRNFHRDSDFLKAGGKSEIHQPALFITGTHDPVCRMYPSGPIEAMMPYLRDLRNAVVLENCGHWTQQERPDEVNALLLEWLKSC